MINRAKLTESVLDRCLFGVIDDDHIQPDRALHHLQPKFLFERDRDSATHTGLANIELRAEVVPAGEPGLIDHRMASHLRRESRHLRHRLCPRKYAAGVSVPRYDQAI